jgi:VCBS repeat-containing protein
MAGKHRSVQQVHGSTRSKRALHHRKPRREPYRWLGAGAVTIGMGVALANGAAIAHADEPGSGPSSSSGGSSASGDASTSPSASDPSHGTATESPASQGSSSTTGPSSESTKPTSTVSSSGGNLSASTSAASDTTPPGSSSSSGTTSSSSTTSPPASQTSSTTTTEPSTISEDTATASEGSESAPAPADLTTASQSSLSPGHSATIPGTPASHLDTSAAKTASEHSTAPLDEVSVTVSKTVDTMSVVVEPATEPADAPSTTQARTRTAAAPAAAVATTYMTAATTNSLLDTGPSTPTTGNPIADLLTAIFRRFQTTFFNESPTATAEQYPGQSPNGVVTGTVGAADSDGDPVTVTLVADAAKGTVVVRPDGSYTYTPSQALAVTGGTDTFTVTVSETNAAEHLHGFATILSRLVGAITGGAITPNDGSTIEKTVTVTIAAISPPDSGPVAGVPASTVDSVDSATGTVRGHLTVTDPGGDPLTFALAAPIDTSVGVVTVDDKTGNWTFTATNASRLDAWKTAAGDAVTFGISVTDGETPAVTVTVVAPVTPAAQSTVENILGAEQESWGNQGLVVGPDGRFYMTTYQVDGGSGEVVVLNPDGTYATTIHIADVIPHPFSTAYDIAVGPDGRVFVSGEVGDTADDVGQETGGGVVVVIDPNDDYAATLFAETADPASAITVDSAGRVFVANWNNDDITVFNADGSLYGVIESAEVVDGDNSGVAGLAVGPDGLLYLTKPSFGVVKVINPNGSTAHTFEVDGEPWAVAVAANGIAYVTDFNQTRIVGLDATGAIVRSVGLGYEASPSDVTITENGTVYVSYSTANGNAIAVITAVPIAEPDSTTIGDAIAGLPANVGTVVSPVVATDVIYQTVTGTASGQPVTTVAVIGRDGATTFAHVSGEPVGPLVLGPGDIGYQTVRKLDATTGTYQSGVLVVTPTGTQTFSGWFSGEPAGTVMFGAGNTAYQVVSAHDVDADTYSTTVLKISPTGVTPYVVTPYVVSGYSGGLGSTEPGGLVAGPGGTLYLTTTDTPDGEPGPVTTVTVIGASGITSRSIAGMASGPATIVNGTVYQTVGSFDLDPDSGVGTFTSVVAVLTGSGLVPLADTIAGLPVGSPVVATDGAIYQTVITFDPTTGSPSTTIAEVAATGLSPVFEGIPGTPTNADGAFIALVAGPDGSVYQATYGYTDPITGEPVTLVAGLTSAGVHFGALILGQPVGAVAPADGMAYQTTYDAATDTTRVAVITPTGPTTHEFDGYPGNPASGSSTLTSVVVGPDGTAYLSLASRDPITLDYTTTVAIISPDGVQSVAIDGFPSGPVIFAPDGSVYQTVGNIDFGAQAVFTRVVAVDPGGLIPVGDVIRGNPAGPSTFGPDGQLYQTVFSDDGFGGFATTVHLVDTAAAAFSPMAAGLVRAAAAVTSASSYSRTIDDAYLAPFRAADPTARFSYTQYINSQRGQTFDFPPMSDADLVKYVNDYLGNNPTGSQGFAQDSQGRITYRNTNSQDVLVAYGSRPDRPAQGAVLARPGATVVLSAGPEGRVASAQLLGRSDWAAIAYRGATPIPTTPPKTGIQLASTNTFNRPTTTVELANRVPGSDEVKIDIIRSADGKTRMVVYMGGVIPLDRESGTPSWIEAFQVRQFDLIPSHVSAAIDKQMKAYNATEIMLVGHSKGGMIAQNYAEHGQYKDKVKVIVTYGAPIVQFASDKYLAIHLNDGSDAIPRLSFINTYDSNSHADRIYVTPPTNVADKHSMDNYKVIAQNFEWDSKWTGVKSKMRSFGGQLITSTYPSSTVWAGGGGSNIGFA